MPARTNTRADWAAINRHQAQCVGGAVAPSGCNAIAQRPQ
nr:MAG TPA: hypothetical protein [Caudoviricetes sp.]